VLSSITDLKDNETWKLLFENMPTVSARTILSKFQNDYKNTANIVLGDIRGHLQK
jgi:GldM N-terminal domain